MINKKDTEEKEEERIEVGEPIRIDVSKPGVMQIWAMQGGKKIKRYLMRISEKGRLTLL